MHLKHLFLLGLLLVAPVAQAQDYDIEFEYVDCPISLPDTEIEEETIDCGYLLVPEDRSDPDSPVIELAVAILYSPADDDDYQPDPILYLEGGPGGSALSGIDMWYESPLRETRDIILFDQRGTGYSRPYMGCYVDEDAEDMDELAATQDCRDSLVLEGVNLSAYNSQSSVQDMADLREIFEIDEWNLLGISYGTRLALTAMRDDPDGIRSVILDSVYPPQVQGYEQQSPLQVRAFEALFASCAADAACNEAYPDLDEVFYEIVAVWNDDPWIMEQEDPETGEFYEVELNGDMLIDLLGEALYDTTLIPYMPLAIYYAYNDDPETAMSIFEGYIADWEEDTAEDEEEYVDEEYAEEDYSESEGMMNSVECYEEIPFNSLDAALAAIESLPESVQAKYRDDVEIIFGQCDVWAIDTADTIENEPVTSEIPTLVVAGEFDPVTPPAWAEAAAAYLPNSYYFRFPEAGHGIMDSSPCAQSIYAQFLNDPTAEPDGSCTANLAVTFVIE